MIIDQTALVVKNHQEMTHDDEQSLDHNNKA